MAFPCGAPCGAGTAGPAAHRVVPGSQPTQCNTLGLARGSGPFEPPTGESAPLVPPSPPPIPSPSPMTEASMAREATATRVCGASRSRARRGIASTGSLCAAVPWRSSRLPWRTRSAARSRQPTAARTCSSGHRLPRPGCGAHAPGPPRSPLGDGPFPHPPSPGSLSGNRAAPPQSQARAPSTAADGRREASRPYPAFLTRVRKRAVKGAIEAFEAEFIKVGGWIGRQRPTAKGSELLGGPSGGIFPRKQRHLYHRARWPHLQGPGVTVRSGAYQGGR